MFKAPFSFKGRISKTEYRVTNFLMMGLLAVVVSVAMINEYFAYIGLLWLPGLWFFFAQGVKRCHDLGKNGWHQVTPFYTITMLFSDGTVGNNEYGPDPKEMENKDKMEIIQADSIVMVTTNCPACGHPIKPTDSECTACGINFESK